MGKYPLDEKCGSIGVAELTVTLSEDVAESLSFTNNAAFDSSACHFLLYNTEHLTSVSLSFLKYKLDIRIILWDVFSNKEIIVLNIAHKKALTNVYEAVRQGIQIKHYMVINT